MAKTVFVVDDDAGIRELLKYRLEQSGFAVETGTNGRECLDYLEQKALPALVLLDVRMPHMDGLEVLETIRAEIATDLPVVLLTGAKPQAETGEAATERISKPFTMDEVVTCVERVLDTE